MTPRPPRSALFPYTTLFRSLVAQADREPVELRLAGIADAIRTQRVAHATVERLRIRIVERVVQRQHRRAMHDRLERRHRSEEHTSELQSPCNLVCRLLLEKQ